MGQKIIFFKSKKAQTYSFGPINKSINQPEKSPTKTFFWVTLIYIYICITYHIAMHVSARVSARENLYQPEGPVSARGTRADTCPRADTNSEG